MSLKQDVDMFLIFTQTNITIYWTILSLTVDLMLMLIVMSFGMHASQTESDGEWMANGYSNWVKLFEIEILMRKILDILFALVILSPSTASSSACTPHELWCSSGMCVCMLHLLHQWHIGFWGWKVFWGVIFAATRSGWSDAKNEICAERGVVFVTNWLTPIDFVSTNSNCFQSILQSLNWRKWLEFHACCGSFALQFISSSSDGRWVRLYRL